MSAIPPGWLGSIIQGHGAQQRASEAREKEATSDADAARKGAFADKVAEAIETGDRDTQAFADGHGAGSQGRSLPNLEEGENDGSTPAAGDKNAPGIDLEA
jgi:hypothetical protein